MAPYVPTVSRLFPVASVLEDIMLVSRPAVFRRVPAVTPAAPAAPRRPKRRPKRPRPPRLTNTFCTRQHAADDVCAICLGELTGTHSAIHCKPQRHCYHTHCLEQWFESGSHTCPKCRSVVKRQEVVLIIR